MSRRRWYTLIAASIVALAPHTVRAQKDVASCKPVLDAFEKSLSTGHHVYSTTTAPGTSDKPTTYELISAGGQNYVLVDGKWTRSPMTVAASIEQSQENVRNAKTLTCKRVRGESVGGAAAVVYREHSDDDEMATDVDAWVGTGTGLVLRTEGDMSISDGGGKSHMSTRYEYTNVQPPPGVH